MLTNNSSALSRNCRTSCICATPHRIECFDISNISGTLAVRSMVCFQEGQPDKQRYRRYRIQTLSGPNDYGMMLEVLRRRYRRALAENDLPDLLMVDGGKGQLNMALGLWTNWVSPTSKWWVLPRAAYRWTRPLAHAATATKVLSPTAQERGALSGQFPGPVSLAAAA